MKRKRGESYHRPNDLWFDDGSVVLQVENTQFRVHRTMLSKHSVIFRDMFKVPQPPPVSIDEEVIEGCPVVRLQDSAQDWTFVLQAMYSHGGMTVWRIKPTFILIAAYLRLGTKYEISELRLEAIGRLSKIYPSTLAGWDSRPRGLQSPIQHEFAIRLKVANLAEEMGVLSILPSCLYEICEYHGLQVLINGSPDPHSPERAKLSSSNRERLLAGFISLQEAHHIFTYGCLDTEEDSSPDCTTQVRCHNEKRKMFHRLFAGGPEIRGLDVWDDWYDGAEEDNLCGNCVKVAMEDRGSARELLWDTLPSTFNLSCWAELTAE